MGILRRRNSPATTDPPCRTGVRERIIRVAATAATQKGYTDSAERIQRLPDWRDLPTLSRLGASLVRLARRVWQRQFGRNDSGPGKVTVRSTAFVPGTGDCSCCQERPRQRSVCPCRAQHQQAISTWDKTTQTVLPIISCGTPMV